MMAVISAACAVCHQHLHSFLWFTHLTRSHCTDLKIPITSDNLTKSSPLIYQMLASFVFPSLVTSWCPEMNVTIVIVSCWYYSPAFTFRETNLTIIIITNEYAVDFRYHSGRGVMTCPLILLEEESVFMPIQTNICVGNRTVVERIGHSCAGPPWTGPRVTTVMYYCAHH